MEDELLQVRGLRKAYGRRGVPVVDGVDLVARAGEVVAFLGPNGAGKTTTLKMIAGLIRADGGSIRLLGKDPQRDLGCLREIGAVLEGNRNLYWRLTAEENLRYFAALRGVPRRQAKRRAGELLELLGLTEKRREPVRRLSRGMQQKLAIAAALIHQPRLLLLDEPTLGLDPEASERVKTLIRGVVGEQRAILLTSHRLRLVEEVAHRVVILDRGRVVVEAATPDLLRRSRRDLYRIRTDGPIDAPRRDHLARLGAGVVDGTIEVHAGGDGLYRVLEALEPLPLEAVERDGDDLTGIFLGLFGERHGG